MNTWIDDSGTLHEKCKLLFLVGNDLISEGDYDPGMAPELGYRRVGVVYICQHCGQPWGHAVVLDSKGVQMPFEVDRVACEKHPDQHEIPGSLLSGYRNHGYLTLLSPRALKREFVVHHQHYILSRDAKAVRPGLSTQIPLPT